jgi:ABC-type uncharacterized transport system permease subunit
MSSLLPKGLAVMVTSLSVGADGAVAAAGAAGVAGAAAGLVWALAKLHAQASALAKAVRTKIGFINFSLKTMHDAQAALLAACTVGSNGF